MLIYSILENICFSTGHSAKDLSRPDIVFLYFRILLWYSPTLSRFTTSFFKNFLLVFIFFKITHHIFFLIIFLTSRLFFVRAQMDFVICTVHSTIHLSVLVYIISYTFNYNFVFLISIYNR